MSWFIFIAVLVFSIVVGSSIEPSGSGVHTEHLLVFISITSGPHHSALRHTIRSSWIEPCKSSKSCDYRFFIDVPAKYYTKELLSENKTYNDMVFRDFCPLMDNHATTVNYGNTVPKADNLVFIDNNNNTLPNPDYPSRRYYKIDWKVCFMRWTVLNHRTADFHVFVEDDSFMCTKNLLHQCNLLKGIQDRHNLTDNESKSMLNHGGLAYLPFRTGFPSYSFNGTGFDDSSTFMSGSIANAFAFYYKKANFDCRSSSSKSHPISFAGGSSWGNSWRPGSCHWREVLRTNVHTKMDIHIPVMNCSVMDRSILQEGGKDEGVSSRYAACPEHPLILHHKFGGEYILSLYPPGSSGLAHLCENMLLLDKVKNTTMMMQLWQEATASNFKDYSSVFMHEGTEGWPETLRKMAKTSL